MSKPTLISFKLCPFVQRSVITLLHKKVDFDIKYIDLANKPDWFLQLSPLGKVPILEVDSTVLFESAVINEYLDEISKPSMHPADPLKKAQNRAYIEYASNLLMLQYGYQLAKDNTVAKEKHKAYLSKLTYLEEQLEAQPYFNGDHLSLVDMAYAPLFIREEILEQEGHKAVTQNLPKLKSYSAALLQLEVVKQSVVPDFKQLFLKYLQDNQSHLFN